MNEQRTFDGMTAEFIQKVQETFEEHCRHYFVGTGHIQGTFDFYFEIDDCPIEVHGEAIGFVEEHPGTYFDPPYTTGDVYFEPIKVLATIDEEDITDKIKTFINTTNF